MRTEGIRICVTIIEYVDFVVGIEIWEIGIIRSKCDLGFRLEI